MSSQTEPVVPDYAGACTANVVPEIIKHLVGQGGADWLPEPVRQAKQVVLLVVDGMGWEQLQENQPLAPTISTFIGGPITTVAPTSTVPALTSLVTGRPPSVHGLVGTRVALPEGDVLDVLPWMNRDGDARATVDPNTFQVHPAFAANDVPVVTQRIYIGSGFSDAHLRGARVVGYSAPSSIPLETWRLVNEGEEFVYVYYPSLDTIAHAHGLGEHYGAELYTVDRLVRDVLAGLPDGCALVVTSDHGQVQVGGRSLEIEPAIVERCWNYSGEGRFRWLHVNEGRFDETLAIARETYADLAWVMTKDDISNAGWFGGPLDERVRARLGDIALVPSAPIAFNDPTHGGERNMQCRHGSLTSAEMMVPLVARLT